MHARARAALVLLAVAAGLGCGKKSTDYLLHVESEIKPKPDGTDLLRSIRVRTWDTDDVIRSVTNESSCFCVGTGCRSLPVTMLLLPTGAVDRRFQIEVTGFSDSACTTFLLSQTAKLQFVPEASLDAYMDLTDNCVGVMCPTGQTCAEGFCLDPSTTVVVTSSPDGGPSITIDMSTDDVGTTPPDLAGADLDTPCTPLCFAAGTEITLASGVRRPIESITEGDAVGAVQEETQWSPVEPRAATVTHTLSHVATTVLVLTVEGREIVTTAEHPFAVVGRGFVPAGQLRVGDPLLRSSGKEALVQRTEARRGAFPVYNLEVAGDHTYFVSDLQLVVHNKIQPLPFRPCL